MELFEIMCVPIHYIYLVITNTLYFNFTILVDEWFCPTTGGILWIRLTDGFREAGRGATGAPLRNPPCCATKGACWIKHGHLSKRLCPVFWKGTHGCIWSVGPSGKANVTTGGQWCLMVHRTSVQRVAAVKENSETGDDRTEKKRHTKTITKKTNAVDKRG